MRSGLVCSRKPITKDGILHEVGTPSYPICLERPTVCSVLLPPCDCCFLMFNSKFRRWSRSRYALTIPVWLSSCPSPSSLSYMYHIPSVLSGSFYLFIFPVCGPVLFYRGCPKIKISARFWFVISRVNPNYLSIENFSILDRNFHICQDEQACFGIQIPRYITCGSLAKSYFIKTRNSY